MNEQNKLLTIFLLACQCAVLICILLIIKVSHERLCMIEHRLYMIDIAEQKPPVIAIYDHDKVYTEFVIPTNVTHVYVLSSSFFSDWDTNEAKLLAASNYVEGFSDGEKVWHKLTAPTKAP